MFGDVDRLRPVRRDREVDVPPAPDGGKAVRQVDRLAQRAFCGVARAVTGIDSRVDDDMVVRGAGAPLRATAKSAAFAVPWFPSFDRLVSVQSTMSVWPSEPAL